MGKHSISTAFPDSLSKMIVHSSALRGHPQRNLTLLTQHRPALTVL